MHELVRDVFSIIAAISISIIIFLMIYQGVPVNSRKTSGVQALEIAQSQSFDSSVSARSMVFAAYDKQLNERWLEETRADGKMRTQFLEGVWTNTNIIP